MGNLTGKKIDLTPIWDSNPFTSNKVKRKTKGRPEKIKKVKKKSTVKEFIEYRTNVYEITNTVKHLLPGIENRGYRKYHIDHKISIKWGFDNKIPASDIAHISNLQLLWWKDNFTKNVECLIDPENEWIIKNREKVGG